MGPSCMPPMCLYVSDMLDTAHGYVMCVWCPSCDPKFDPKLDPKFDPKFDPKLNPKFDPKF